VVEIDYEPGSAPRKTARVQPYFLEPTELREAVAAAVRTAAARYGD
jgi:hypothetical protein